MHLYTPGLIDSAPRGFRKATVARILLADTDLASRLTLKSLLCTAGYAVDGAATCSEAIRKLDRNEYQLVLADLRKDSEEAGARLLSYARQKEFRPATALISSDLSETWRQQGAGNPTASVVRMSNENISYLLGRVADLIGDRADRRIRRSLQRVI
jgi:CheY-like chemotaxis protein